MNELRKDCSGCGGTGKMSWLRRLAWLSGYCQVTDDDGAPYAVQLDCYSGKRIVRIEFKRQMELTLDGQSKSQRAELESTGNGWQKRLYIIRDWGQKSADETVRYQLFESGQQETAVSDLVITGVLVNIEPDFTAPPSDWHEDAIGVLGKVIGEWVHPEDCPHRED